MNFINLSASSILVDLHGLKLVFHSPDIALRQRFELVYGHLPRFEMAESTGDNIFIDWQLHQLPLAPPAPSELPAISEGKLVSYYGQNSLVAVRLPKYGLIIIDLAQNRLDGVVTSSCLDEYGAFEDVLLISLAPLYRRRGWFPLHAFAAVAPAGQVALISGAMGSGKTTTGLALLEAGWKLLSNDSPLLRLTGSQVEVLAYPGRLSAFDDSLARFERLHRFIPPTSEINLLAHDGPQKRVFRAEEAFDDPWATLGFPGGLFFPQVTPGLSLSKLEEIPPKEALLELVPQAIEGWDRTAIEPTLHLLGKLTEQIPCYRLKLSPYLAQLPILIAAGMNLSKTTR
jgi:hypothetical protein